MGLESSSTFAMFDKGGPAFYGGFSNSCAMILCSWGFGELSRYLFSLSERLRGSFEHARTQAPIYRSFIILQGTN